MKYVYHYHATTQPAPGIVKHGDGLLTADGPIATGEELRDTRKKIALEMDVAEPTQITIRSLTLLHALP